MREMLEQIGEKLQGEVNYGQIPDAPDNITILNLYGGLNPKRSLGNAKPSIKEPMIQLRVRNQTYIGCLDTIYNHIEILEQISGIYGNINILKLSQNGDVIPLGRDSKNRYEFTINFIIQINNN